MTMPLLVSPVPEALPDQFAKMYRIPVPPETDPLDIEAYAVMLELYHPLPFGVP
jgi:hypothetical protein